jgi:RND family efflux transporter MFP subunit
MKVNEGEVADMPVMDKHPEEKQAMPNDAPAELQQSEAAVEAEVEPRSVETSQAGASKRSERRRTVLRWALLLLVVGLAGAGYLQRERLLGLFTTKTANQATSAGEQAGAAHKPELKVLYWQDPMHPAYKSDKPGKALDCGMDLVPVYETGAGQTMADLPEGAFQISPEKQQLIGVQYGEAVYKPVFKTLRTVGRLTYDETKIVRIHTKVEGWIEKVYVDFTGKEVKKGQPLISIYSPELLQTQQEYLLALKGRDELSESPFREAVAGSESLLQAARKRLELWDISDEQIDELEKAGKPNKTMTLYAPAGGFVLSRNSFPKQRVTPEMELYAIANLSTIWVIADVYEYEAPEIKIGQSANVTLAYYSGRVLRGRVDYIYPQLDAMTRTLKVRIEVPNPKLALKPDMYANAELKIDYGKRLVAPQEAVLDSGSEQLVFVAHEGGFFEPRKIQLGPKVDNNFIVLGGLKAGEKIVTSANFLIDSESRLKSAAGGMGMPGMDHGGAPASGVTGSNGETTPQADHSQHQQSNQPSPQVKPPAPSEDHSQHQMNEAPQTKPGAEDHSQHQMGQPQQTKPKGEDHSQHQAPKKQE